MAEKKHDTKRSETQLIGEVCLAHVYHHEKKTKSPGGAVLDKPHFASVVMSPKLGPAESCPNYKRLADMAMEAAAKAWGGWPDGGKWPIEDGDIPYPHKPKPGEKPMTPEQLAERNKWRVGYWCIDVTNYLPTGPKVSVLRNGVLEDIPTQTIAGVQLYKSGDFGYVSMNAYTFHSDKPGGKWGVNFSYEGVAYTRAGELIGGGPKSTAQMFAGLPVTASPPTAPAPGGAPALPTAPTAPSAPVGPGPIPTAYAAPASSPPMPPAMPPAGAAVAPPLPIPGR